MLTMFSLTIWESDNSKHKIQYPTHHFMLPFLCVAIASLSLKTDCLGFQKKKNRVVSGYLIINHIYWVVFRLPNY
jgi:hypothetical protein